MSQVVLPDEGLVRLLDWITGRSADTGMAHGFWMLVAGSVTWDRSLTYADVAAVEASFTGYARIAVSVAMFGSATAGTHTAEATPGELTFTCTGSGGAQHIYGWALIETGPTGGGPQRVIAAAEFDSAPKTIDTGGQTVKFTPTLTTQSLFTSSP